MPQSQTPNASLGLENKNLFGFSDMSGIAIIILGKVDDDEKEIQNDQHEQKRSL